MQNWQRWVMTFALGAFGGAAGVAAISGSHAWSDYGRAAVIGMLPATAALKMTLDKNGAN